MQRLARRTMSSTAVRLAAAVERPAYETWRVSPPIAGQESSSKTYAHQQSLPPLPVPDLSESLRKLRASGKAVARDEQEKQAFESALDEFEVGGLAQTLQKRLKAKAGKPGVRNWLAEDWDRLAYMTYRDSVVCNVSYFYGFNRIPQRIDGVKTRETDKADPAYVAASIAAYSLWHRDELAQGNLPADSIGKSTVDMESFKWLYNACRIPSPDEDYAVKVKEDDLKGDHFILIRQNRFYKLKFRDDQGKRASLDALYTAIQQVYHDAPSQADPPLGVLTGINRDAWAKARAHLIEDSQNSESLRVIEDAAFVICLDAATPSTVGNHADKRADFSNQLWRGNARCRFYDKPLQWVVFDSGESGIIGEHSCMDGTPTASLNDQMTKDLIAGKRPPEPAQATQVQLEPEPLAFDFDQQMLDAIAAGEKEYDAHVNGFELRYLLFEKYGKDSIKACKTSPDGWVQMVMQLAYALTHQGQPAPTYESAQTRRFALGRTEVVRVCTEASRAWTDAMLKGDSEPAEKRKLFKAAVEQQGIDMKDASMALGIDRHLLGLKRCLLPDDQPPALFGDPVFVRSSHWQMSTSQVYGRQFSAYGWGPVVEDGYGLPYMIHPESLMFTITAHKGMPIDEMLGNIEKACDMVLKLMSGDLSPKL